MNCGSVFTKRRTLKPAMAVDTQTTASPASPRTRRQLIWVGTFFRSRGTLFRGASRGRARGPGLRFQSFQQFLARLPHVSRAQREHQVALGGHSQQGFYAGVDRAHILHPAMAELAD